MFALRLFGVLSLENGGQPVPSGALQRRRLTLLAMLGLSGERGTTREKLQAYLWPESTQDRARHALDQLVYASRRDLGPGAILSSASDLRLNTKLIGCDVIEFDAAIAAGDLEAAVALYAGPILDGLHPLDCAEFERWLDAEREKREQDFHRALDALARAAESRGDPVDAVRWYRRRAAAEPLSAPAAMSLMHALATVGDRAGAVQHARVHQRAVRTALDVDPDPRVEVLADAVSRQSNAVERLRAPIAEDAPENVSMPSEPSTPWATRQLPPRWVGASLVGIFFVVGVLLLPVRTALVPERAIHAAPSNDLRTAGLPSGDGAMRASLRTADPESRRLYLLARNRWNLRTKDGLNEAVVLYRQATERDPTFAPAYAGMAQAYAMLGYFAFAPGAAMFPKARASALRALDLDPSSGDAYAALGQALASEHRWGDAEAAYRKALAFSADNATVHQWYALLLAYEGRTREAVVETGIASRLDPLSVQINNFHGVMLYDSGDLKAALSQFARTVDAEPDSAWVRQNPWVLSNYGHILGAAGRYPEAVGMIERSLAVVPHNPRALLDLATVYARSGRIDKARAVFAEVDTAYPHYALYRGLFHAAIGELDSAFASLDRVQEWPLAPLVGLNNDPVYRKLRSDPRYARVLRALALDKRGDA